MNEGEDWRQMLITYLKDLSSTRDRKTHRHALKYTLVDGELYRRTLKGLMLKCLGEEQARVAMGEVHEGLCETHQSTHKMRWTLRRDGVY
jgi:hypothetical protein